MVSASGAGLVWDSAEWWLCVLGFADWLVPGGGVNPLAGAWETDEEQEVEDHQDHLRTSAAGSGS